MSIFLFLIRWIFLIVILCGACSKVKRLLNLKPCFSVIVTLSSISLLVYLGGIIGLLRPITYLLILGCIVCTFFELKYIKSAPIKFKELPVIQILFSIGALCFIFILSHNSLVHYDNFTHWALVVKEMLITHSFPTADNVLIEFTNYPTGSASWIYFVCTVVGNAENSMIMAQSLLIFAGIYSLFGIIEERGRFLLIIALGSALSLLSLFNFSIRINNLLVDFILPVLTLSAISLIYSFRNRPKTLLISVTPILGLLVVIKSTGVIFSSIAIIYMLYVIIKSYIQNKEKIIFAKTALCVGLSFVPLVAWNIRMNTVFANVSNKFETDLSVVNTAFGGKTNEEVIQICKLFLETITDITSRSTMGVILFEVVGIIACVIGCFILKKKWALPKVLIAMNVVLVLYLVGILAMYIFSMPLEEALYLAAFERYSSSIVVLFAGVLSICLVVDIESSFHYKLGEVDDIHSFKSIESKNLYLKSCIACVILLALILTSEYNGMIYQTNEDNTSISINIKEIVGDNWSNQVDDSRYLLFASDADGNVSNYYIQYVAKYYLRAENIDGICLFYEDNFLNLLSQYDYLVIIETSDEAQYLMEKYLGLSGEEGIYDLSNIN